MTIPGAGIRGGCDVFAAGDPGRAEVLATLPLSEAEIPAREALGPPSRAGAAVTAHAKEDSRTMSAPQPQTVTAAAAVRRIRCNLCQARPGRACTRKGDHLARWLGACSAGRITRGDLRDVIVRLVVVTRSCVVTAERAT
jgi:hypothetical protein